MEEEKKSGDEEKKEGAENKGEEDHEMIDESEKNALSTEQIIFDDEQYAIKMSEPKKSPDTILDDDDKEELIKGDHLESILEKEFLEQDKKIEKALEREKDMRSK